jgi:hypothetical protein
VAPISFHHVGYARREEDRVKTPGPRHAPATNVLDAAPII